jgi:D-alanyl-D-alanine carboxypeptidase
VAKTIVLVVVVVVVVVVAIAGCAATPRPLCSTAMPRAPDAPATIEARIAADYVATFDAGDPAALVAYAHAHRSPLATETSDAELAAGYGQMARALGCLTPRAVHSDGDHALTVLVDTEREDRFAFRFAFDDQARIRSVSGMPAFADETARSPAEAAAIVTRFADELAGRDRFSGVVLLAHDGVPFLLRSWGLADRERAIGNDGDTRFHIASVGKMFTAVAVLQLAAAGKLRLDDRVDRFVSLPAGPAITIAQLLTHTSGLVDNYPRFHRERAQLRAPIDYIARFSADPLAFPPGTRGLYSNFGFVVLARVVELASGQPFDAYLRDHVFGPAAMTATSFDPAAVPHRARPYAGDPGHLVDATAQLPVRANGYGCEYSTADDLLRFVNALVGHTLLPDAQTARMLSNQLQPPMRRISGITAYGYGVILADILGQRSVGHDGGAPGVSAFVRTLPDRGYTVIVLSNLDGAASRIGPRALRLLAALPR